MVAPSAVVNGGLRRPDGLAVADCEGLRLIEWDLGEDVHDDARSAVLRGRVRSARFTSTEVVYGVTGTEVTELPEYGVLP
jgi:hypothetical protein